MATKRGIIVSLERAAGDQRGEVVATWTYPKDKVSVTCIRKKGSSKKTTVTWSTYACIKEWQIRWWYKVLVIDSAGNYTPRWVVAQDWQSVSKHTTTATFTVPDGATNVWFDLWMEPDTYAYYKNATAKEMSSAPCFTGATVSAQVLTGAFNVPEIPEIQSAAVADDGVTIKVSVKSTDPYAKAFQAQGNDGAISSTVSTKADSHSYESSATLLLRGEPGSTYSIRARTGNVLDNWSKWRSYASVVQTKPGKTSGAAARATSEGTASVSWAASPGAAWYEIAYANSPSAFSLSSGYETKSTKNLPNPTATTFAFDDIEPSKPWYFWVRACNSSGDGAWSDPTDGISLGSRPSPPTVWADSYSVVRGESFTARWAHNATDGTAQGKAEVRIRRNGGPWQSTIVEGREPSLAIKTEGVDDGGYVEWCVRTWGAAVGDDLASPFSEAVAVRVWERPSLTLSTGEMATRYPVAIRCGSVSGSQKPVSLSVAVTAAEAHEVESLDGERKIIPAGSVVWSKTWANPEMPIVAELTPWDVVLSSGQPYGVLASCVMSSGLGCEAVCSFLADMADSNVDIEARIDPSGDYGCEVFGAAYEPPDVDVTDSAEPVETDPILSEDVLLSIYRHETDGSMTPLMVNIPNDGTHSLIDSHAPLSRQRYRIVAVSAATGAISWEDACSEASGDMPLVIQWDGANSQRVMVNGEESVPDGGDGSAPMELVLPWDISIDEESDRDVSLVEYAGRRHPVAYSGTQLGQTATWKCSIDKLDQETIDLVRALASYRGEAYVRDPTGNAYWAAVKPSLSAAADSPLLGLTLNISRTDTTDACIDLGGAL